MSIFWLALATFIQISILQIELLKIKTFIFVKNDLIWQIEISCSNSKHLLKKPVASQLIPVKKYFWQFENCHLLHLFSKNILNLTIILKVLSLLSRVLFSALFPSVPVHHSNSPNFLCNILAAISHKKMSHVFRIFTLSAFRILKNRNSAKAKQKLNLKISAPTSNFCLIVESVFQHNSTRSGCPKDYLFSSQHGSVKLMIHSGLGSFFSLKLKMSWRILFGTVHVVL